LRGASVSKLVLVQNLLYKNEFDLENDLKL